MKPIITRFNPTVSGPLHVGHLYMALVNQYEAHSTGGSFLVRLDDNQSYWQWKMGPSSIIAYADLMRKDFDWLGLNIDGWSSQFYREDESSQMITRLSGGGLEVGSWFLHPEIPETPYTDTKPYPYAAHLTAEKVALDFLDEVTLLIRGEDLLSEYSLYSYFCDSWGIPNPRHVYLPRLRIKGGADVQPTISKTLGNFQIFKMREAGATQWEIVSKLADACLKNPQGAWSIDNIKEHPMIEEW
jgi:glutamyl/glutaminyl-tRNA synthetase